MRTPLLIAAAILIAISPVEVMAKKKEKEATGPAFSTTKCRPYFPCANLDDPDMMDQIERKALSISNSCVQKKFLLKKKDGSFFRDNYGMDSNLCFKAKKRSAGKSGLAMTPKCCIKPVKGKKGMCYVRCKLIGLR